MVICHVEHPHGHAWLLQEITARLPGRVDTDQASFAFLDEMARALRRPAMVHGRHEERTGRRDAEWPIWYAQYLFAEQAGKALPR